MNRSIVYISEVRRKCVISGINECNYLNITAGPLAVISLARGLGFPAHLYNASCELPRGSKISEILEPFGKARSSRIFEIFGAGGATKNLENFWSHGPCFRSGFPLGGEHRSGTENQILSEFIGWLYLSPGIYALPRAAA